MNRYGHDYYRPGERGWNRYDAAYRGRGHSGHPQRGRELYFDQVREPWEPPYQGYGYPPEGPARGGRVGGYRGGRRGGQRPLVGGIMTRDPETVTPDTPLAEVARRMRDLDVGLIPVVDDRDPRRLRGVITDRDIAVRAVARGDDVADAPVSEYMTADVATVRETDDVRELFDVMKRERLRRVPVTDDAGRLIGIVAQADLAVGYAGLDLRREAEVEEVIERISEPGPFRAGSRHGPPRYDRDIGDRLREGWRAFS